jgi:C-terminal processing protease CtpA/Prc
MLDRRTAYLRPGPFYNGDPGATDPYDNAAFRRFIDTAFQGFLEGGADRLVIDLRDNPGGDSSFSDLMVRWFATRPFRFTSAFQIRVSKEAIASNDRRLAVEPAGGESVSLRFAAAYAGARPGDVIAFDVPLTAPRPEPRFKGQVYVLVNRRSYSNAVAVAALVQDYGFGTILGEETSDLATTFGAMETFTLPRTGLVVGFPKACIVRPRGDLVPRGVVPDIAIETPVVEGVDDPVLTRVRQIVEANP